MVSKISITKVTFLAPVFCIALLLPAHSGLAASDPPDPNLSISRIEVRSTADGEEVLILAEKPFKHSAFLLSNPDRLVIDIPDALMAVPDPQLAGDNNFVKSISTRSVTEGDSELVRVELTLYGIIPYQIGSTENGLSIKFGQVAIGSAGEAADARSMTKSLPTPQQTVADDSEPGMEPAAPTGGETDASKVYGITPVTKYKGKPIFLDLKDADILDIFRLIAEVSGFNVVVDPDVGGRITIRMDNVPWDQALEVILKNQGLGKEIEGNVMRIARNEKLRDENVIKQQLEHAKRHALPLETVILYLSYADINDMETSIHGLLSDRGTIMKDLRVNALIVRDIRAHLDAVTNLVRILDVRTRQVSLNSQIVVTQKQFARNLGIQWGGRFIADAAHGNTTGYRFPNNYTVDFSQNQSSTGGDAPGWNATDGSGYAVNLPSGNTLLALSFGNVTDTLKLNVALSAAEQEGLIKTMAHPRVTTANNEAASINSGYQIPYQVNQGDQGINVQFQQATTQLTVTPHITNDNWITMDVNITRNAPGPNFGSGPSIFTNTAQTRVLVKDGGTIVIGGLNETSIEDSSSRIPWLNQIPILGWLFKNSSKNRSFQDLLFFITPQIMEEGEQVVRTETF
ncbi:type IV pilus secretin PilQ [bacterium]|nr:type IV pilus secretin PilQ [candidate division CSSED10-310 bacterium]